MKRNVGTIDKIVRILIAVVIAVLYFTHAISGTLAVIFLLVAGVFLLTGACSVCPLYIPFKINTSEKKDGEVIQEATQNK